MAEKKERKNPADTFSFLDFMLVLSRNWKFIFWFTLAFAVFILLFSILSLILPPKISYLPNLYTPTVVVRLSESADSSLSSLMGSGTGSLLSGLAGISEGPNNADLSMALVRGNTIVDSVISEFHYIERFKIKKEPLTRARELFQVQLKAMYEVTTGLLEISYTNYDPEFATDVLNFTLQELEKRFKELTMETITAKKDFLETRLAEVEEDLEKAQQTLIDFQLKYGIFNIEEQGKALLTEITKINSELVIKELALNELKKTWDANSAPVRAAEREIQQLETLLKVKKSGFESLSPDYVTAAEYVPQSELPEVAVIYANLTAELKIHSSIKSLLRQQYEMVKLEEADNSKIFQIVERAQVPEVKSEPSRGWICIITTFAAFFVAVFISFFRDYLARAKTRPEEAEKLAKIREYLPFKSRKKK